MNEKQKKAYQDILDNGSAAADCTQGVEDVLKKLKVVHKGQFDDVIDDLIDKSSIDRTREMAKKILEDENEQNDSRRSKTNA
jgi:hypothetical protein